MTSQMFILPSEHPYFFNNSSKIKVLSAIHDLSSVTPALQYPL